MMPNFVSQLQVPLIVITDSRSYENIYFKDSSYGQHFLKEWTFNKNGFVVDEMPEGSLQFTPIETHPMLQELDYMAQDWNFVDVDHLPKYHIVQTCIPSTVDIENCHIDGYMFVVVGQEVYDDSPFVSDIRQTMRNDVDWYYLFILIIFLIVKFCLFLVLWTWLRIRVTQRMNELIKRLKTND